MNCLENGFLFAVKIVKEPLARERPHQLIVLQHVAIQENKIALLYIFHEQEGQVELRCALTAVM